MYTFRPLGQPPHRHKQRYEELQSPYEHTPEWPGTPGRGAPEFLMNTALDAASMLFNMLPPGSLLFKTTTLAPAIQLNELDKFTLETLLFVLGDTPSNVDPSLAETLHQIQQLNDHIFNTKLAGQIGQPA